MKRIDNSIQAVLRGSVFLLVLAAGGLAAAQDGVIGYWPLDGSGADLSGGGRNLGLAGGIGFAPGLFGQALDLHDNGTQFAARPVDDAIYNFSGKDFTVQIWVNFNNNTFREQTLIEKFFDGGGPGWTLTHVGGGLQFYAAGAIVITSPPLAVPSGVWHHILTRRSGTLYQVFYDGIVVVAGPSAAPISGITMPLLIGKRNDFDGRDFAVDGRIDEVAIWSRALSDDEVAFLFNGGRGNPVASLGVVPFAALSAEVEIERDDAFEVRAAFTLGAGSNGIAPLTEDVKLRVGTFSVTIPAGSFTQDGGGQFMFEGVIAGATLEVEIEDLGGGSFEFKAEGEGANLTGTVNPVTVALTIGDDVGTTTITAEFSISR